MLSQGKHLKYGEAYHLKAKGWKICTTLIGQES